MTRTAPPAARDTTLRVGTLLLLLGAAASVVTVIPFLLGGDPLPLPAYLLSLLAPIGLAVILLALARRARGRRTRIAAARDAAQPGPHAQ